MEFIVENTMKQRCVFFSNIIAGIEITSHPLSARIAAINVKAPVVAGTP